MDYSGLNAKIKAMRGRLLPYEEFENLSRLKTVEEVGLRLKEHPSYARALASLEGELRRGSIEHRLYVSLMDEYRRLYNFMSEGRQKKYAGAFFLRNEIGVLKLILGEIFDERETIYSPYDIGQMFGEKLSIDISRISEAKSVEEFIESLKGTQYYPVLAGESVQAHTSLFMMETKLDVYYYINLWRMQNEYLDKDNIKAMSVINSTEIELRNLMWLYRLKRYYRMNETAVYGCLIPAGHSITNRRIADIVRTKTDDELTGEIIKTKYGKTLMLNGELEKNFYKILSRLCRLVELKNPYSLATLTAYVNEKTLEINNLTSLIEGVRYGLKPESVMDHLCFEVKK